MATQTFTSKGTALKDRVRPNLQAATDPKPIRARLGSSFRGIAITNPAYTNRINQRTASLGMGRVGQRGRGGDPA